MNNTQVAAMAETFLININCSKILPDSGATQYTMFIDSSKMSIVYELVEWIRWMFSLESCFYLTHENSVIHELEDIQLLSKLKNFEITPCGQPDCVHKKLYRALLKNLNFIVSWNEMKVHKYFLDKINQMSEKLSQVGAKTCDHVTTGQVNENSTCQNSKAENGKSHSSENQEFETNSDVGIQKQTPKTGGCTKSQVTGESPSKTNSFFNKIRTEKQNFLLQLGKNFSLSNISNNSVGKNLEAKKPGNVSLGSISSKEVVKKELKADQVKSNTKPKTVNKYTKPFSLGEILTNIREDFEKKNAEMPPPKENISEDHSFMTSERNKDITAFENSLLMQDKITVDRKRQRTRKRKRSKKQNQEDDYFTSFSLENKNGVCSLNFPKSDDNIKPNHIRFDDEPEDFVMELESASVENENEFEVLHKEVDNSGAGEFMRNGAEELFSVLNGNSEVSTPKSKLSSPEKNSAGIMECSPLPGNGVAEDKLIDIPSENCENINQSFSSLENLEVNGFNPDLSDLLSLREKFKKGIVIQRFY